LQKAFYIEKAIETKKYENLVPSQEIIYSLSFLDRYSGPNKMWHHQIHKLSAAPSSI